MDDIPSFPNFARLSLSHKDIIRAVTKRFPPYSDFNFVSLFTWDTDETMGVSTLHGNLIVRFRDYTKDDTFLSLLGTHKLSDTLKQLFDYCYEEHIDHKLQLIPHSVIKAMTIETLEKYEVRVDKGDHDYIISTHEVVAGHIARTKRAMAKRFARQFEGRIRCTPLDLTLPASTAQIREVTARWNITRKNTPGQDKETLAIERCLRYAAELDVQAFGVYIDEQLVAFIMFEIMAGPTAMMHYAKSDYSFPNVTSFMKIEIARYLASHGIEYMNFEQDLGLPGLRRDKEAYHPAELLKKFSIEQKL